MKKILAMLVAATMILGMVNIFAVAETTATGSVYYLNFKPEQAEQWEALAKVYTEQTGVPVTVVTAASGTYEDTLRSEIEKPEAPTLFQVNGPVGLKTWSDYCLDLSDTEVYKELKSDDFALKHIVAALFHDLWIWGKTGRKSRALSLIVKVHSRIMLQVRLHDENFHAIVGSDRKRKEGQTFLVPFRQRLHRICILERVIELALKGLRMLLHIRNIGIPILCKSEFSLLAYDIEVTLQRAYEPVCHAVIERTEHEGELLEFQCHLVIIVPHLRFLVSRSLMDQVNAGAADLADLIIETEDLSGRNCH